MSRQLCPYCGRSQRRRSRRGYQENPFCRWCLHERVQRAAAGDPGAARRELRIESEGDYFILRWVNA